MKYSFVIPCYRSENTISIVVEEIQKVMCELDEEDYEVVLVNDNSPDNVWSVIKILAENNSKIKGISLARNFGQHSALIAGYNKAQGEFIVSLDDDGQTPIDELYKLIEKLEEGYDVVYAYYETVKQKLHRRLGSKFTHKMDEILIGLPADVFCSSFYIMRKYIKDEMIHYKNAYPYLVGLVCRTTKNITCVQTKHRNRMEGESGYRLRTLLHLWFNGFSAFSSKPLRISAYVGVITATIGFIYAIIIVVNKCMNPGVMIGWSSLMAVNLFIGGLVLLSLGLIGEYVGRIYISINNAPQYVVREDIGE